MSMRAAGPVALIVTSWLLLTNAMTCTQLAAQESWDPFKQSWDRLPARRTEPRDTTPPLAEMPGPRAVAAERPIFPVEPRFEPRSPPVERSELEPIMAPDASGLPLELWRGLDLRSLEGLLARLELPPRSPALHELWRRVLLSSASPPADIPDADHFFALRLEALYRSGLLDDMGEVLKTTDTAGPLVRAIAARREIGLGYRDAGCKTVRELAAPSSGLPGRLKGEMQLLAGYCAAASGDLAAASLATDLAREEGIDAELPLAVLGALANGDKPELHVPTHVLLLDYRFLELMGPVNAAQVLERAEPALLAVLASDPKAEPKLQVAAAEAALRVNAMLPEAAAEIYRRQPASMMDNAGQDGRADPAMRRALLLRAAEVAGAPSERARMIGGLLEDGRRSGLLTASARMLAPLLERMQPERELDSFAETAVIVELAAGRPAEARRWAEAAGLQQWLSLVDIADPAQRGGKLASLAVLEDLAGRGRLTSVGLGRLATIIDALDIDVPMPLWEASNRMPQPQTGFLPETGVLAELAEASKRKEAGRTILLVMRSLGAAGPEGAHILALGDSIRALRRIGLEAEARRIALEVLLPTWPRLAAN